MLHVAQPSRLCSVMPEVSAWYSGVFRSLGALRCIWPFKELRADRQVSDHKFRLHDYENLWPASLDGNVLLCIALAVVAGGAVLAIDWLTIGHERREPGKE